MTRDELYSKGEGIRCTLGHAFGPQRLATPAPIAHVHQQCAHRRDVPT